MLLFVRSYSDDDAGSVKSHSDNGSGCVKSYDNGSRIDDSGESGDSSSFQSVILNFGIIGAALIAGVILEYILWEYLLNWVLKFIYPVIKSTGQDDKAYNTKLWDCFYYFCSIAVSYLGPLINIVSSWLSSLEINISYHYDASNPNLDTTPIDNTPPPIENTPPNGQTSSDPGVQACINTSPIDISNILETVDPETMLTTASHCDASLVETPTTSEKVNMKTASSLQTTATILLDEVSTGYDVKPPSEMAINKESAEVIADLTTENIWVLENNPIKSASVTSSTIVEHNASTTAHTSSAQTYENNFKALQDRWNTLYQGQTVEQVREKSLRLLSGASENNSTTMSHDLSPQLPSKQELASLFDIVQTSEENNINISKSNEIIPKS